LIERLLERHRDCLQDGNRLRTGSVASFGRAEPAAQHGDVV